MVSVHEMTREVLREIIRIEGEGCDWRNYQGGCGDGQGEFKTCLWTLAAQVMIREVVVTGESDY